MNTHDSVLGVVLAGGQGRRMSADGTGVDKGLQLLGKQAMVAHVLSRLQSQVGCIIINANQNTTQYETLGYPVFSDDNSLTGENFSGPLAGWYAALCIADSMQDIQAIVTVPCDSPFFPKDLVSKLCSALMQANTQVAVAKTGEQAQPVFAAVRVSALENLRDYLRKGDRKIDRWYQQLPYTEVSFSDAQAFDNINTPDELIAAHRRLDK